MRHDLSALAEPLRDDPLYFSNELNLLDDLLADVAQTRIARGPNQDTAEGKGTPDARYARSP